MVKDFKFGKGYCAMTIYKGGEPLVGFRVSENGKLIIDEKEVFLLKLSEDSLVGKVGLSLHGEAYQFLRGELILKEYDEQKCTLSKENWEKLREIYIKKKGVLKREYKSGEIRGLEKRLEKKNKESKRVRFIRKVRGWSVYKFN